MVPTAGTVRTLGTDAASRAGAERARIDVVHQHAKLLEWMRAYQLIRYVATFYPRWDTVLEQQLTERLSISLDARVGTLSPGKCATIVVVVGAQSSP